MLNTGQRRLLDEVFSEAVALPAGERASFLERHCADAEVRREVESLLQFADRPATGIREAIEEVAAWTPSLEGLRVGPYRLAGKIGQGGMGAVYRATRDDDQFQKTVAIKMLRFPDGDPAVLQRFRQERQILATLEHPNIARLLDGGAWIPPGASGQQPYIVMEFVEGVPITSYCQRNGLDVRARLGLFRDICGALSYAHRQLIVHRDIKPSNILVTDEGVPKLLDFGVAKLLDSGLNPARAATTGMLAMTPEYASPEQVRGAAVSTLTDVYSLGVLLYELLTGRRLHHFASFDPLEVARVVCEEEAAPPQCDPDLDVIVLKALQKEPGRRYQSADQFSEDLRLYLAGLPITARPDTVRYRAAKFVRRNRLPVAAAAALLLALTGGVVVSTWEARRARAAEQAANSEAATAKAVTDFLRNDLLGQASPNAQAGPDLKVRTALDRAAQRMEGKFAGKPLVEADVRMTMAESYSALGLFTDAQRQFELAAGLRRGALGERNRGTLDALNSVAVQMRLRGKLDEAEALYTKVMEAQRQEFGEKDPDTLVTMGNLAVVYNHQGKYAQAEALNLKVLALQRSLLGPEDLDTLRTMNNLGVDYTSEGKFAEAEALYKEILEVRRRVQGPAHPNTILTANNLAVVYARPGGNLAAAEKLYTDTLEQQRRMLGPEHPNTLLTMNNLGYLWILADKPGAAEEIFRKTAEARSRMLGPDHKDTLESWVAVGKAQIHQKKFAQAERILRRTCPTYEKLKMDGWQRYSCQALFGESLAAQRRYAEAEPLLLAGYSGLLQRQSSIHSMERVTVPQTAAWLAELYADTGRPGQAASWRSKAGKK